MSDETRENQMPSKIRVAILDDHQSIIDGYTFRLSSSPEIEVVASAMYAERLEPLLAEHSVDVLLMDIGVPESEDNPNPYPILNILPKILQSYPNLTVIIISVYNHGTLIRTVVEAGASGYILKDDHEAIQKLDSIVQSISEGGVYFSQPAYQSLMKRLPKEPLLSPRQLEALSYCATYPEATASELAKKMCVANSTIRNLLSKSYLRLKVSNRAAAVSKARQLGLITPPDPTYELSGG
jgi:DNA-binding NarL/FixJ family response regulator